MPNYIPTNWVNEVPNGLPLRYKITDLDGTVVAEGAMIELLNVVNPGTPVNASNLNKIEQGIKAAQDTATDAGDAANKAGASAAAALAAAAAAQAAASGAVQKSLVTGKGDMIVATSSGVVARLPAGANGQTIVYDSSQTLGVRAGSITPELSLVSLASEATSVSQAWADVLSTTVTLARAGRIRVRGYGQFRGGALYVRPSVRLVIDGVADTFEQVFQINGEPVDQAWRPWALEWFRAGIASGSRQVKLQFRNDHNGGGAAYLNAGARLVIEVDYP